MVEFSAHGGANNRAVGRAHINERAPPWFHPNADNWRAPMPVPRRNHPGCNDLRVKHHRTTA